MRKIIFILLLIIFTKASGQDFTYTIGAGGTGYDWGNAIVADGHGDIFTTGIFDGTCWFDTASVTSHGCFDNYVAKYNLNGEILWLRSFGGSICDYSMSICLDNQNNCYVSGDFQISADFIDTIIYAQNDEFNSFIAKYNSNGTLIWAKCFGGESCTDIKFSDNDFIYVCGVLNDTTYFETDTLYPYGGSDIFTSKLDLNGNIIWIKQAGGIGDDAAISLCLDFSDNVYITGRFSNTAAFGNLQLNSNGNLDIFICKYNSTGIEQWVRQIGGTANDYGNRIAVSQTGDLYIMGRIWGTINIDTISLYGLNAFMITQYDTNGNFHWLKQADGYNDCQGRGLGADNYGNAYVTGAFQFEGYFDNDTLIGTGSYTYKGFFARYNRNSSLCWIRQTSNIGMCIPSALYYDKDTSIYYTGVYCDTTTIGEDTLTGIGGNDIFITRFSIGAAYGINDIVQDNDISLFPNPTDNSFLIGFKDKELNELNIEIYDVTGNIALVKNNIKSNHPIDISYLKSGLYFVKITDKEKYFIIKKIIKT
jgi:hypothetical protein